MITKFKIYESYDIDLKEDDYIITNSSLITPTLFLYEIVKVERDTSYVVIKKIYQYSIDDNQPIRASNYYDKKIYNQIKKDILYKTNDIEDAKKMMIILLNSEQKYNL